MIDGVRHADMRPECWSHALVEARAAMALPPLADPNADKEPYTQVTNVKSSPEGVTAKAMKDGKQVSVMVDSMGKIKERPPAP